ncbi:exostosin family protein [Actinidia rufa]|uniref:Exostosin family protein n=1 Tax=Actinidia rufa TaxID=165716 RepID=A0A7J0E9T6_9ERIC|nr:exostosin family protein [Actinidia rufa]
MGERGICSSSSSLPLRLFFWIIVPLIVVSGLVGLTGTRTSNWVFTSNHYPWVWSSVIQSSSSSNSAIFVGPNSTLRGSEEEGSGAHSDLNPRLVVADHHGEEALSSDESILNRSSSPPVVKNEESSNTIMNGPHINESHTVPMRASSKRKLSKLMKLEVSLGQARAAIKEATTYGNQTQDPDFVPTGATWKWKSNSRYSSTKKESTQFFSQRSVQEHICDGGKFYLPYGEGFNPTKDVSFPEILLHDGTMNHLLGGPSPSKRPVLVFFAGGVHGPVRPILLEHWEDKDEDVQVHKYLPKSVSYYGMMRKSKYCICASGYEVASPRMVEALYMGCIPVLIKDHYVAPFSDVLNWKSFSVEVAVKDIPNLKTILTGISTRQYIRLHRRGLQVRRHFEVNFPPKRFDVFHMILHSVWLRRLNVRIRDFEAAL